MAIIMTPPPGVYDQNAITVSLAAAGYAAVYVSTAGQPTLAKNIAYDTFGNPFISAVEDGVHGNVLFDAGFPKYYNSSWNNATTFAALDNRHKVLHNAMKWLSVNNTPGTPKKILIHTDAPTNGSYSIMSTANLSFYTVLMGVAQIAGYELTLVNLNTYPVTTPIPYSVLAGYSSFIMFSAVHSGPASLHPTTVANIAQYQASGGGIMVITDSGEYAASGNQIAGLFGASVTGSVDRVPVSVDYLIQTYGAHPLWRGMTGQMYAGSSEGNVNITPSTPYDQSQPISLTGPGYRTIYVTAVDQSGAVSALLFSYALNASDPFVTIGNIPQSTIFKLQDIPFSTLYINSTLTTGFITHNGRAIGQFQTNATQTSAVYFAQAFKPLVLESNAPNMATIRIDVPVVFARNFDNIALATINTTSLLPAKRWSGFQQHEGAQTKTKGQIVALLKAQQGLSTSVITAAVMKSINQLYATTYLPGYSQEITVAAPADGIGVGFGYKKPAPSWGTSTADPIYETTQITYFSNVTISNVPYTIIRFLDTATASSPQDFATYRQKKLQVIDSRGVVVFDDYLGNAASWSDQGPINGLEMRLPSTQYITSAGSKWIIKVL